MAVEATILGQLEAVGLPTHRVAVDMDERYQPPSAKWGVAFGYRGSDTIDNCAWLLRTLPPSARHIACAIYPSSAMRAPDSVAGSLSELGAIS